MSKIDSNKELVRRLMDLSNQKDFEAFDSLVAANFSRRCQATPSVEVRSREDFKRFAKQDAITFPDAKISIREMVAEGDQVAVFAAYTGTQDGPMGPYPPTGRKVNVDMSAIFRIEDGMIAELWATWDNLTMLRQLGRDASGGSG